MGYVHPNVYSNVICVVAVFNSVSIRLSFYVVGWNPRRIQSVLSFLAIQKLKNYPRK